MTQQLACWVVLHAGGYNHTDVSVVGVAFSKEEADRAKDAHAEPGNCTVEESSTIGPFIIQVLGLNDMPIAVFSDVEVAERERLRIHQPHPTNFMERARFGWIRDFELNKVPYLPGIHPPPYVPRYTVSLVWSPAAMKYIVQKWEVGKQATTEPLRLKGLRETVLKAIEMCEMDPVCGLWMDDNVKARLAQHGSQLMKDKVAIYDFGSKP